MKRKKHMQFLMRSVLAILAFLLLFVQQGGMLPDRHMDVFFLQLFGGSLEPSGGESSLIFAIFFLNIPWLLLIYVFAPLFQKDFEVQYVYVFTRVGSKQKWLFQRTGTLFLQICLSWALLFLLTAAVGAGLGCAWRGSPLLYIQIFALEVLGLFALSFAQNLLSMKLGITQSFVVALCGYAVAIFAAVAFYRNESVSGWLFPLLPTAGQMALWHADTAILPETRQLFFTGAAGFQVWKSIVMDVIYIAVCYVAAACYLRKADLIDFVKEEN